MSSTAQTLFRKEAIDRHANPSVEGVLLRLEPRWQRWLYWVVTALFVVAAVFMSVIQVSEFEEGQAFVELSTSDVVATVSGRVGRPVVAAGQPVHEGDVIAVLNASSELGERENLEEAFRRQLLQSLASPFDSTIRQNLASLRVDLERTQLRLGERYLRSPFDGVLLEWRVKEGDFLNPGQIVATVQREGAQPRVVVVLPGRSRPFIQKDQRVRLELDGFPYEYHWLTAHEVSEELLGPSELRRAIGTTLGETATRTTGPVIVVSALLDGTTFVSKGKTYHYFRGMPGTARVQTRQRSGWLTIFPILELALPPYGF